jgi:hypothetical protein
MYTDLRLLVAGMVDDVESGKSMQLLSAGSGPNTFSVQVPPGKTRLSLEAGPSQSNCFSKLISLGLGGNMMSVSRPHVNVPVDVLTTEVPPQALSSAGRQPETPDPSRPGSTRVDSAI